MSTSSAKPGPSMGATRLVNPLNEGTTVTLEQLWKALMLKVREPQLFLPFFNSCEVVSDDGHKVVRNVYPKPGFGAPEVVQETCYIYPYTMVYFDAPMRITNIISYNESGELVYTSTFVNGLPGPFSPDEELKGEKLDLAIKIVGEGVEHTLQQVRQMVRDGKF